MNIGDAAARSGLSARMIRHYESVGLLPSATRSEGGYRLYSESDVHALQFIRHARELGFSIAQITQLLELWRNRRRASKTVHALTQAHIADLDNRIASMQAMRQTLKDLADACHGDDRPDCPILAGLEA